MDAAVVLSNSPYTINVSNVVEISSNPDRIKCFYPTDISFNVVFENPCHTAVFNDLEFSFEGTSAISFTVIDGRNSDYDIKIEHPRFDI